MSRIILNLNVGQINILKRASVSEVDHGVHPCKGQLRVERRRVFGRRETGGLAFLQFLHNGHGLIRSSNQGNPKEQSTANPGQRLQLEPERQFGQRQVEDVSLVKANRLQRDHEDVEQVQLRADPELEGDGRTDDMDKGKCESVDPGKDQDNVGPGGGAAAVVVLVIILGVLQEDNGKQGETELKGCETKAGKVDAQARGALCLELCLNLVDGWRV